ncbi:PQQ-dependent sugar dehydrogenase [Terrimonas pollutisoli]|uniref:PQQ-dependent sugar dehydrogenase n=1 Tax=Terrimonas pollutisoli TaxID=3034147 RepID=UPI0023EDF911|nr:PQQ-dependent sugar dehydrogenase [Terrimonas sp. H1YJ31]
MTIFFMLLFYLVHTGCLEQKINSSVSKEKGGKERSPENNYRNYCSGCHGEQMDMFVDRKWKHGNLKENLFYSIKTGWPDEGMPGFDTTFNDDEINGLTDYILNGINNVKKYDFKDVSLQSSLFTSASQDIRLDTVVAGLKVPWGMAFLPDGGMLVTERSGKLYRLTRSRELQNIEGVPEVLAEGQGGLLDIALHPDFSTNHLIYFSYSLPKKNDSVTSATPAVMRARLEGNKLTEQKNIFVALPFSRTRHHFGSRLQFGTDGMLYISVGERGNEKGNPQNINNSLGKIHRIRDDGSIPADNPFVNQKDAVPSIYSYGHRNPQGMTINPGTGEIWINEHGPRGGDEINIIGKGKNYGWPVISYGINYNGVPITNITKKEGMEQPELYWVPSIAPSGMTFVTGDRYKNWKGDILVGSLRFKYLNKCKIRNNKITDEEMLLKNIGRLRDVRMGPDGYIYVSVESPGAIFRLVPVKKK